MFRKLLLLLVSCGLVVGEQALAQSEGDTTPEFDQIIVTGALTPLTMGQLGSAITVIRRDEIEQRQARYVTELLRSVPGFSVSHSGVAGSQTQVRVRGSEANHVLVLIDGVRANDPATGDEFRWEYLTTGNIERIEIVRGPQSSLWGSDALAAVVHVITRSDHSAPNINGYVEGGSNETHNIGVSGDTGSDGWSLSGGVEYLETEGSNISRLGSENDGSDVTTASLAGRFAASQTLTFDAGLRLVNAYSQFDPVDFFVTGLPTDGDRATKTDNLYANIGGRLVTHGGTATHHLKARYFDSDNRNLTDGVENSSTASDRTTIALQSDINLGDNRLSLALEHERTHFEQRGEINFGDPNQNQEMDVTSVVVDFQGLAHERFTWLASARFDSNSEFDDSVNGRVSLSYRLSDKTTIRGKLGTGQKNPTFIERFGFFPGQFVGNPELKPERSISYDIGLDQELFDSALIIQLSLFKQNLKDEINGFVFDPATFLSSAENMDGTSERSGVELAARWNTTEQFWLSATYTYTDSTEQDSAGMDVRELRRPRHSGSLAANFRSNNDQFQASLSADYGGERDDIFFPPFPEPSEIVTLQSYWLLDLTAQFQVTPAVSIFARGTNLLDEDYEQVYGYQTLGRAGYLGVRMNFGR